MGRLDVDLFSDEQSENESFFIAEDCEDDGEIEMILRKHDTIGGAF